MTRPRQRLSALALGLGLALLTARPHSARAQEDVSEPEVTQPELLHDGHDLRASWSLRGAFTDEIRERVASGIELSFEYAVELRRKRSRFLDKRVAEREVSVTVRYSNLTKMYTLTRRVDGTVSDQDVTERLEQMVAWMTEFRELRLFDERDLSESGDYYVRLRAHLLDRYRLLVIPSNLRSSWATSDVLRVVAQQEPPE